MTFAPRRFPTALGSLTLIVGAFAVGTPLAAASSAPPDSEPDDSAPALDATREDLVNAIIAVSPEDFPFDRNCVVAVVGELADDDVSLLAADIAESEPEPTGTVSDYGEGSADGAPATDVAPATDSGPGSSVSAEAPTSTDLDDETLREIEVDLTSCLDGDADPALVDQALAIAVAEEGAEGFDEECMAGVLGTFEDATLEHIIAQDSLGDDDSASSTELDDEQYAEVFNLLACAPADFFE